MEKKMYSQPEVLVTTIEASANLLTGSSMPINKDKTTDKVW